MNSRHKRCFTRMRKNSKIDHRIYTGNNPQSKGTSAQNTVVADDELIGLQMEYTAVREESILLMEEHNTQLTNVFVVGVAFLTLVYSVNQAPAELFLLMYVLMIPLQVLINNKAYMLARCGAYIEARINPKIKGLHWENVINEADEYFNKKYKLSIGKFNIEHSLCVYGTFLFSFIALISYVCSYISIDINADNYVIVSFRFPQIIGVIWCIVGTIVAFRLCKKGFKIREVKNIYSKIFSNEEILRNNSDG